MNQYLLMGALSLTVIASQAQDFKAPLTKTFTEWQSIEMDTTAAANTKRVELSNKFGLIAKKWKDDWAPHYYSAYTKTVLSYNERDEARHDAILDEADKELEETVSLLGKNNDETYVLAAMIANSRMVVNPMQRWQKYGKVFQDNLESAKEINASNPRMYYLKAVSTFFTPKNFGGGKKAALPYFEKAQGFFDKEAGGDVTKPYWGKAFNTMFMDQCKKGD
jgi:hypothetical protein